MTYGCVQVVRLIEVLLWDCETISPRGWDAHEKMLRMLKRSAIVMLIALDLGCAPKGGDMQVAYMRGNLADGLRPDGWDYGQVKECQIASQSTQRPDQRGDLLFCGSDTLLAWNISWLRPDLKSQIYENARPFAVTFRSAGHSSRNRDTWWRCQRTPDGLHCD